MAGPRMQVIVTHFINPNRFYVCDLTRKTELDAIRRIEIKLQDYCADHKQLEHVSKGDVRKTLVNQL